MARRREANPSPVDSYIAEKCNEFTSAEVTSCVVLHPKGETPKFTQALLVVVFSRQPTETPDWETITKKPLSIGDTKYKLGVWRLRVSASQASRLLTVDENRRVLTHPIETGLAKNEDVAVLGDWARPFFVGVGRDDTPPAMKLLPTFDGSCCILERFGGATALAEQLGDKGAQDVLRLIAEHTPFGLAVDGSRLGAVVVAWPEERVRLQLECSRDSQRVGLELALRGLQPSDVRLHVEGRRGSGFVAARMVVPTTTQIVVDLQTPVDELVASVFSNTGTLLHRVNDSPIREINIEAVVQTSQHTISIGTSDPVVIRATGGSVERTSAGGIALWEKAQRQAMERARREEMIADGRLFFYSGGPEERSRALKDLRQIISNAHSEIVLWDPFIDGTDMLDLLRAISFMGVRVRVLSAGKTLPICRHGWLLKKVDRGEQLLRRSAIKLGIIPEVADTKPDGRLWLDVAEVVLAKGGLQVEWRQGFGFHDRFIMVDETWWHVGHSFNAVGGDIGAIVQFPYPELVRAKFDEVWARSVRPSGGNH